MFLCHVCRRQTYTDARPASDGNMVDDIRTLCFSKVVSGEELVRDALTYSMAPGHLEPLMVEGRIGNKLDLLGLTPFMKPEILLKVDRPRVQGWGRTGDKGR